jgi:hypothetical protein
MSQKFLSTAAFAVSLSLIGLTAAQAAPAAPVAAPQATSDVILVEGGCGPGAFRDRFGRCRVGGPVVIAPVGPPVVVVPPVVAAPVVCERGFRWHPRFRRCVVL